MSVIKELFDCETLITEVEKRPPLYDFQLKEYSDKNIKEKLWSEACEAVVSDWNTLSPEDKKEKGSDKFGKHSKRRIHTTFRGMPSCCHTYFWYRTRQKRNFLV
ncbi:uncharacterized protein LOC143036960 isoform X1 [Oratosquilla oratoria]|uniref:uncharacterized protein LOC143036960 isoform X1 n=1 Tax=Oratosquilla oratoria TaxID=337810 RepID=UPI003F76F293